MVQIKFPTFSMNYIFYALLLTLFAMFSAVAAQTSASTAAQIGNNNETKKEDFADAESLKTDFKNFTFPNFAAKEKSSFTLKNGKFQYADLKKAEFFTVQLRKVYYFDVTGDLKTEAIAHILATTCAECLPKSVFYIYSNEKEKPKEVWKIAVGIEKQCGLKEVRFDQSAVILETFGDCVLKDWTISGDAGSKKTDVFTRFVFNRKNTGFVQDSRELLPFPAKDIPAHRSQLKFGGKN